MCLRVNLQSGDLPGFSPLMFLPIMCLPYLVLWLSLSWWWVIPLTFLYLSYLHNIKTRHENRRYATPPWPLLPPSVRHPLSSPSNLPPLLSSSPAPCLWRLTLA
jgi:hypothetical protein